jgi:hypothetical protein
MVVKPIGPETGGCLCGAVRYTVTAEPVFVVECHCRFCQQALGTAYNTELLFGRTTFGIFATPHMVPLGDGWGHTLRCTAARRSMRFARR